MFTLAPISLSSSRVVVLCPYQTTLPFRQPHATGPSGPLVPCRRLCAARVERVSGAGVAAALSHRLAPAAVSGRRVQADWEVQGAWADTGEVTHGWDRGGGWLRSAGSKVKSYTMSGLIQSFKSGR